jgi:nuclear transport factor 2 (NTF2) superfamily protein
MPLLLSVSIVWPTQPADESDGYPRPSIVHLERQTHVAEIVAFLKRKWARELDYRLVKELWAFNRNRISVRFEYESRDRDGRWWRSHGNEHWEFDDDGYMSRRDASIDDIPIEESERRLRPPATAPARPPADSPGAYG